jgi:hypothetical protein
MRGIQVQRFARKRRPTMLRFSITERSPRRTAKMEHGTRSARLLHQSRRRPDRGVSARGRVRGCTGGRDIKGYGLAELANAGIGAIFTGVSIARGYILRRVYETYLR